MSLLKSSECKPAMAATILQGVSAELRDAGWLQDFEVEGPTVEEPPPEDEWKEIFHDEVSGAVLDTDLVHEARKLEVEYVHKLKVHREVTREEMSADGC